MSLIKHLLLEITDAKKEALWKIFEKKYILRSSYYTINELKEIYSELEGAYSKAEETKEIDIEMVDKILSENKFMNNGWETPSLKEDIGSYITLLEVLMANISIYINIHYATFNAILSIDPTPNSTYTMWCLSIINNNLNDVFIDTNFSNAEGKYKSKDLFKDRVIKNKYTRPFDLKTYGFAREFYYYGYGISRILTLLYTFIEDISKNRLILEKYDSYKKKNNFPQEYKDINKIKSFEELFEIIDDYEGSYINVYEKIQNEIKDGIIKENVDYKILGEDDEWLIINPISENGSCAVGFKTNWCTASGELSRDPDRRKNTNLYNSYKGDKLITFINKQSYKNNIQIQPDKNEYRDYKDSMIGIDGVRRKLSGKALEIFERVIKTYESN